jgi:hypothetical protein
MYLTFVDGSMISVPSFLSPSRRRWRFRLWARERAQELFGGSETHGRRFPSEFLEVDAAEAADAHAFIEKEARLLSSR